MSDDDIDDAFENLRAQVEQSEYEPSELTLLPTGEVESLRSERDENADAAKEPFAMALSEATGMDKEMLMKHDADELRDEYQERLEARRESAEEEAEDGEGEADDVSIGAELAASLTDPEPEATADTEELEQTGDDGEGEEVEELTGGDLREAQTVATRIEKFENHSNGQPQWQKAADRARDDFEELTGVEYGNHEFDLGM